MTPKQELKKLIDECYELDVDIKIRNAKFDIKKKRIKELTAKSKLKIHRGNKRRVHILTKQYGAVESPLKVWNQCKGDKKLFFALVKVLVTKLEDTFDESVVKKLVSYKPVKQLTFKS